MSKAVWMCDNSEDIARPTIRRVRVRYLPEKVVGRNEQYAHLEPIINSASELIQQNSIFFSDASQAVKAFRRIIRKDIWLQQTPFDRVLNYGSSAIVFKIGQFALKIVRGPKQCISSKQQSLCDTYVFDLRNDYYVSQHFIGCKNIQVHRRIKTSSKSYRYLITDLANCGDLVSFIYETRTDDGYRDGVVCRKTGTLPISKRVAKQVFKQIVQGVFEMHSRGFAHLDLKPENILVFSNEVQHANHPHPQCDGSCLTVKITDFGFSKKSIDSKQPLLSALYGTDWYAPPEMWEYFRRMTLSLDMSDLPYHNAFAADIWALGCLLRMLTTGQDEQLVVIRSEGFRNSYFKDGNAHSIDPVPEELKDIPEYEDLRRVLRGTMEVQPNRRMRILDLTGCVEGW